MHKKCIEYVKGNYRPISILANLSKVFERCIYKQISEHFENILSKYQCRFKKGHSKQHCLVAPLEKSRYSIDHGLEFGYLTELSKAFDCLPHDLFIVKLDAYEFDNGALRFTLKLSKTLETKISDRKCI